MNCLNYSVESVRTLLWHWSWSCEYCNFFYFSDLMLTLHFLMTGLHFVGIGQRMFQFQLICIFVVLFCLFVRTPLYLVCCCLVWFRRYDNDKQLNNLDFVFLTDFLVQNVKFSLICCNARRDTFTI